MQQFSCEKQKQQLGVHFLLFKHLLLFGYEKKTFFLFTGIKPNRDKRNISTGQVLTLPRRYWRGAGHAGSVPTAPCCPLSWAGQSPPQILSTSHRQHLLLWMQGFLPQGYPGQKECSAYGVVLGLSWELSQAMPFRCAVILSWIKGAEARLACPGWYLLPNGSTEPFTDLLLCSQKAEHSTRYVENWVAISPANLTAFVCLTAAVLLRRGHLRISTTGQWFLLLMGFFCNHVWSSSGSVLTCPTELYIPGWKISLKTHSETAEPTCFLKPISLAGQPAGLLCGKCAAVIFWLV